MDVDKVGKFRIKRVFTHFTQIPVELKDTGIDDPDVANIFQTALMKSRELGYYFKGFAWAAFKSVFIQDKSKKKWIPRIKSQALPNDNKNAFIENVFDLLRESAKKKEDWNYKIIENMQRALGLLRDYIAELEDDLPVKGEPIKEEVKPKSDPDITVVKEVTQDFAPRRAVPRDDGDIGVTGGIIIEKDGENIG